MKSGRLVYILMPVAIVVAFAWAPRAAILGDTSRIIYFHVPLAWVSVLAFLVSAICSIRYLAGRGNEYLTDMARNSAGIGFLFTVLTLITGSLWAKMSWGSYWNWDPRETSIVMLLLIYVAYFSLHSSLEGNPGRGRISSVYLILAMVTVPFFVFVIPRVYHSLHPDTIINREGKLHMETTMRVTLLVSAIAFTFLYVHLLDMKNRLSRVRKIMDEKAENEA
jgi:heme exporter protein C